MIAPPLCVVLRLADETLLTDALALTRDAMLETRDYGFEKLLQRKSVVG